MRKSSTFPYRIISFSVLILLINITLLDGLDHWPKRVLVTNDNGIDDIKIIELARAFAKVAETYVVAPMEDRSSSTHLLTVTKRGSIKVEKRNLGEGIHAYAVDGYPADCVLLAYAGIMREKPPDLVVSGINGGPNLGLDWLFSGTIGAARVASLGLPAIAVSGLDDDMPDAVRAATQWVVRLAQSSLVRELEKHQYLTVSIPRVPPSEIKGIRIALRADPIEMPIFNKAPREYEDKGHEIWRLEATTRLDLSLPDDSDVVFYESGFIVVVPMKADEHDYELMSRLKATLDKLPAWPVLKEDK